MLPVLDALWAVMLELSPWLLLGAVAGGLLHGLVPPGFVQRQLTGLAGVVKAVFLGVPLPLCSCGVIPAGLSLRRSGASTGASVGFLIATPQTGVDSMLVSASFLGWPFALYKVAAAMVTGVVGGALAEAATPAASGELAAPETTSHADRSLRGMALHAVDLVRMIWRWLVFGVVVSALISTLLPAGSLESLVGGGAVAAFLLVLVASVPLYVCATASVPIAAALVAGGMPTGAALVFLMAGPATNVATIGAVHRAFGRRALVVYLATIVTGSVGLGLLYEQLFGALSTGAALDAHEHTSWWAVGSAVVLLSMFAWFLGEELRSLWSRRRVARAAADGASGPVEIPVGGMTCGGCAARLERVLAGQDGVESASVSFESGHAVVVGTIDLPTLHEAIRGAGFEPPAGSADGAPPSA